MSEENKNLENQNVSVDGSETTKDTVAATVTHPIDDNTESEDTVMSTTVTTKNKFYAISKNQFEVDCPNYNYDDIKLPKRATKHSAGYDIFALEDISLAPGLTIKIPTGIKLRLDDDCVFLIVPRSSLGFKYKLKLDNTVGVIDADYYNNPKNEGHMWISMTNMSPDRVLNVKKGEAICQGIITKYYVTADDEATAERVGGFGSTTGNN